MTIDFIVITAAIIVLATASLGVISQGTEDSSANVSRCMKIQGKMLGKDITYKKKLKRMARRCSKL